MLRLSAHPVAFCWMLLRKVWNRSNFSASNSQHLLLFRDRRSVAQQCWIRLHSSSNTVGATHAHYAWFTKTYGLYPFHDVLQVPTLLGVVASVYTPLPTRTLLRPFASSLRMSRFWIIVTYTNNAEDKKTSLKIQHNSTMYLIHQSPFRLVTQRYSFFNLTILKTTVLS